jgi:hypothetical protein
MYEPSGTYKLAYAVVYDIVGNAQLYTTTPNGNILQVPNYSFTVINNSTYDLIGNTNNSNLAYEIEALGDGAVIGIDFSNNPQLSEAVFDAIQGEDKTLILMGGGVEWIFNGLDITEETKNINLSVDIKPINQYYNSNANDLKDLTDNQPAVVLSFADNGQLPGKAKIRVKADYEFQRYLGSTDLFVYYYNNLTGQLEEVKANVDVTNDGFVEFEITHNSTFVLTSEIVDSTPQDNIDISTAKGLIEDASYSGTQANITTIAQAKARVEAVIGSLSLNGVSASIADGVFTPAVAGTSSNVNGTNGSYTFAVNLNKGAGAQQITAQITLTIAATAYVISPPSGGGSPASQGTISNNSTISQTNATPKYGDDLTVTLTLNGNKLTAVKNGNTTLKADVDYTVNGNIITLNADYLNSLKSGEYTFTFGISAGTDPILTITVGTAYTVSNGWFNDSLDLAVRRGLLDRFIIDGKINAAQPVAREDFIAVYLQSLGIVPLAANELTVEPFEDVSGSNAAYINTAKQLGIVVGVNDAHTQFNSTGISKRIEFFQIIKNMIDKELVKTPNVDTGLTVADFSDGAQIAAWAIPATNELIKRGLIIGDVKGGGGALGIGGEFTVGTLAEILDRIQ